MVSDTNGTQTCNRGNEKGKLKEPRNMSKDTLTYKKRSEILKPAKREGAIEK
jgi:hypothetical protein